MADPRFGRSETVTIREGRTTVAVRSETQMLDLARTYLAASGLGPERLAELVPALDAALARCQTAWPALSVAEESFVRHLASKLSDSAPEAALASCHVEDLYLAFACAGGDAAALTAFANEYDRDIQVACAKVKGAPPVGEVKQVLYDRLFVDAGASRARVLDYAGQGKLRGWFRVTVGRTILDHLRASSRAGIVSDDDRVLAVPSPSDDPEAEYLKTKYRHEFKEAFAAAVMSLQPEQRNVLRSYYAKELNIDEIATMFGIHRATAARRVNRAREALMGRTRAELTQKLRVSGTELESVLRLIESQLHVSIERLLG